MPSNLASLASRARVLSGLSRLSDLSEDAFEVSSLVFKLKFVSGDIFGIASWLVGLFGILDFCGALVGSMSWLLQFALILEFCFLFFPVV